MQHVYGRSPVECLEAGIFFLFCAWGCQSEEGGGTAADAGVTANGGTTFEQSDTGVPGSAAGQGGADDNDNGGGSGGAGQAGSNAGTGEPDAAVSVVPDASVPLSPERQACADMCARQIVYNAATPCDGFAEGLCFATCTSVTEYAPYIGCAAEHTELLRCQINADAWICQPFGAIDAGIDVENEVVADPSVCVAERAVLDSCSPP